MPRPANPMLLAQQLNAGLESISNLIKSDATQKVLRKTVRQYNVDSITRNSDGSMRNPTLINNDLAKGLMMLNYLGEKDLASILKGGVEGQVNAQTNESTNRETFRLNQETRPDLYPTGDDPTTEKVEVKQDYNPYTQYKREAELKKEPLKIEWKTGSIAGSNELKIFGVTEDGRSMVKVLDDKGNWTGETKLVAGFLPFHEYNSERDPNRSFVTSTGYSVVNNISTDNQLVEVDNQTYGYNKKKNELTIPKKIDSNPNSNKNPFTLQKTPTKPTKSSGLLDFIKSYSK